MKFRPENAVFSVASAHDLTYSDPDGIWMSILPEEKFQFMNIEQQRRQNEKNSDHGKT